MISLEGIKFVVRSMHLSKNAKTIVIGRGRPFAKCPPQVVFVFIWRASIAMQWHTLPAKLTGAGTMDYLMHGR